MVVQVAKAEQVTVVVGHKKVAMSRWVTKATEDTVATAKDTEAIRAKFVGVVLAPEVSKRATKVRSRVDGSKNYRFARGSQAVRE